MMAYYSAGQNNYDPSSGLSERLNVGSLNDGPVKYRVPLRRGFHTLRLSCLLLSFLGRRYQ
jgi:hypothetical protein